MIENSSSPSSRIAAAHITMNADTRDALPVTFATAIVAAHFDSRSACGPYFSAAASTPP